MLLDTRCSPTIWWQCWALICLREKGAASAPFREETQEVLPPGLQLSKQVLRGQMGAGSVLAH